MGGNRVIRRRSTQLRVAAALGGLAAMSLAATACDDDEPSSSGEVEEAAALTAIVEWQAGEQEPAMNDNGQERLPVIYVVAADGDTIDVGVQADVAEATVDIAEVRFADESAEAFDDELDDEPVIADGVLLLIGAMPEPAPVVDVELLRYLSVESASPFTLQITAGEVVANSSAVSVATVTSVSEP